MRPRHLQFLFALLVTGCLSEPKDDYFSESVEIPGVVPSLVINEILFDPLQSSTDNIADQADFVEIYNPGTTTVDLTGWSLADRPGKTTGRFTRCYFAPAGSGNFLAPGQYGVITADKSKTVAATRLVAYYRYLANLADVKIFIDNAHTTLSLNNDGDCIRLLDSKGRVVDSIQYTADWHNPALKSTKRISLEKFHPLMVSDSPLSWTSSTDAEFGGTPGKVNSVYITPDRSSDILLLSPDPFWPASDGSSGQLAIRISLPAGSYQIALAIYDNAGRKIRTLASGSPTGPATFFQWNGLDDNSSPASPGSYSFTLSATSNTGSRYTARKSVILAR